MSVKESLTSRQLIFLLVLFLFGSSVVIGVNINSDVGQDSWIALLFSFIFSIPIVLIFSKIISMFPEKNIYEIMDIIFGKNIGKILNFLFFLNALYLVSIELRIFSEFVEITTLSNTPPFPVMLSLMLIVIYLAKSGINILSRWGPICIAIIVLTIIFTIILSTPVIEFDNLKPVLEHNFKQISSSAFSIFMAPFSEITFLLGMADCFKLKNKEKKTFLIGIFISGLILIIILFRNIMVLGVPLLKNSLFSSYEAARIIKLGEFLTRIEGVITINFVLAGVTKITLLAIVVSKGLAHLSKNLDYKKLIVPSCLLILAICPFLFEDVIDVFDFASIYIIYAFPIQVLLPVVIFAYGLYKKKKEENKKTLVQTN